jgi:hypothetical protein
MKNRLLILFLFLLLLTTSGSPGHTQEEKPQEPATKLESFLSTKGILLVKDFHSLGWIGDMNIKALVVYRPGQETQSLQGLRIEISEYLGQHLGSRSHTSFLDLDEIQSLSKAIAYMIDLSEKWKHTTKEYTEVIFLAKGGFQIGFYQDGTKQKAFASSGGIGRGVTGFSIEKLTTLKDLVDQGVDFLAGK